MNIHKGKGLFQDEAPYFQEILDDISQKIGDLKDMNREQEIPELIAAQQEIQEQFDKATVLAKQLEGVMADFSDERGNLQKEIEEETEWLNKMKEALAKCDDVSGTDEDLVQRLQNSKVNSAFPTFLNTLLHKLFLDHDIVFYF